MAHPVNPSTKEAADVTEKVAKKTHEVVDKLANLSEDALGKVDKVIDAIQNHAKDYGKTIEDYMHEKPIKTVAIAVLAGMGLATLLRILHK